MFEKQLIINELDNMLKEKDNATIAINKYSELLKLWQEKESILNSAIDNYYAILEVI